MRYMRILLWTAGICLTVFLLASMSFPQSAPPQSALSKLSDKDLFKRADAEDKAGRPDSAREAILIVVQRAIDKKKKPDQKYQDMLNALNTKLADREAATGEAACSRGDLPGCQKQVEAAKRFAVTPKTSQLEATFNDTVTKLRQEYQSATTMANGGNPEPALTKLYPLTKYEEFLPGLMKEIERVRAMFLQKLLDDGRIAVDEKRWDDASTLFQRALQMSNDNALAKAGIERVERGRKAYTLSSEAAEQSKARRYQDAFKSINLAIASYPETKTDLEQVRKQISQSWVDYLMTDISSLLDNQDDLAKSREAYLRLQKVLELNPAHAEALNLMPKAKQSFVPNSAQYAQKLADIKDLSRIATATVLKYDVQRLMPDLIPPEELKTAMSNFNSKRICQLVLSVEDLSSATADFTQSIQARARSIIDNQSLRDLRLRSRSDYEKAPNEDAQFQYLLPDAKSYTAVLTINITRYEFRRSQIPSEVKSRYIFGTEKVPNPEYDKLSKRLDEMHRALNSPSRKKGKPTREGWTEMDYERLSKELDRTDKLIDKEKSVEYTYPKVTNKQSTNIEVEIVLRDYYSKEVIAQDKIPYIVEREGVEISGVRDTDVSGVHNQPSRLPDKDESLAEGSRAVREELDKKIPRLLRSYTDRFFNEGEKQLKAGHLDEAVEAYLCHWAFFGGHLEAAQMDRIAEIVKAATAFDLKNDGGKLMAQLLTVAIGQ